MHDLGCTGPASTLALTLAFLMTNNIKAASLFGLTSSLPSQPPHLLGLRVMGRALVMWSLIKPCKEWIQDQLPKEARVREMRGMTSRPPP